jgi:DNA gyrase subunit A
MSKGIDIKRIKEILARSKVLNLPVKEEMSRSFISYAMAVNVSRAIPDVRDGLKPVHRRILYAMQDLGNTHDKPYKKCARIVGEVLGKYHPHGDAAVYDALVRMAQDFSINEPLIEGHGNFGSVDGDPPAAQRYTEARLSRIAGEMLKDIDKETVDFYPNFDDTLTQPAVLPSKYPNLLVNGSEGIAVGMATSIPPHNLKEVIDCTIALIDNPEIEPLDLMKYIPAPDFPTGGKILVSSGLRQAYLTGRGRITVRAKAQIVEEDGRHSIVVTELPYQVNKATLIKNIADQVKDKKINGISDIREESDRFGMRVVFILKRDANPEVVLNTLYKQSSLQTKGGIHFLALVNGVPTTLGLKGMLSEYIKHQVEVIERRTKYLLTKALDREHIVKGLVIALENIDRVIEIIKRSRERQDALANLMQEFELSEIQAGAILDMRLARLTGLEIEKLVSELNELIAKIAEYRGILADPQKVRDIIKQELREISDTYGKPRKSELNEDDSDIDIADLIEPQDVVISKTYGGYVKRIPVDEYKAQNRGGTGVTAHKTKDEDFVSKMFICHTHDDLLFFSNKGKVYCLKAFEVPEAARTAKGRAIVNLLPVEEGERITAFLSVKDYSGGFMVMATKRGLIKKTALSEFESIRVNGKIAISLLEDDELINVELTTGHDEVLMASAEGKCIRFAEDNVRAMGRTAQGVKSISLSEDDYVIDMAVVKKGVEVITITENGFGKRVDIEEYRLQSRAGKGIKAGNYDEKTGKVVSVKQVSPEDDIIIIADNGVMIRTDAAQISKIGRNTKGVKVMRVKDDAKVVAVALTPKSDV